VKWKKAKAALAKQAPERSRKSVATGQPAAPKAQRAGPSAEQMDLGEGWNHVVRGGRVVKATTTPPTNSHPKPPPQPVTEAPEKPTVTATREMARPKKPEPNSTAASKRVFGKSKKKAAASVLTAASTSTTPKMVVPTKIPTYLLEKISDLLAHLPLNARHVDWNSRLNTRRGKLLRDYADEDSCLIFGPDSPTTNPYNPSIFNFSFKT